MAKSVLLLYIAVEQFAYTVRSGYISLAERDTVKLNISSASGKPIYEQIEDQIYHYILDTPIEPGAKLPNEFELGEKFGVGRSTIREARKHFKMI